MHSLEHGLLARVLPAFLVRHWQAESIEKRRRERARGGSKRSVLDIYGMAVRIIEDIGSIAIRMVMALVENKVFDKVIDIRNVADIRTSRVFSATRPLFPAWVLASRFTASG